MKRLARVATLAIACMLLLSGPAAAWNPSGHQIVALIAYHQLDDATKAKAVKLLKEHPRFKDHFEHFMPKELLDKSEAEKDAWIFAHAAAWPDQVRDAKSVVTRDDVTKYSRPWWHFIDVPVYLNAEEEKQLNRHPPVNLSRSLPDDPDDPDMNIVQAFKNSSRIVGDSSASAAKRAVHICWLLHLAGDSHQPLHSSALFTTRRFRGGDHGGNYLDIHEGQKLHGFWDDQIATEESFPTLLILANNLEQNPELVAEGKKAAAATSIDDWIDESCVMARKYVYTPEVLGKVSGRETHSHLGPLDPPSSYEENAERISERQAMAAGYRAAKVLQQLLQ